MGYVSEAKLRALFGVRYFATLSQAGTAAPTVTSGALPTGWVLARTGVGTYTIVKAGAFAGGVNKTIIRAGVYDQATGKMISGVWTDANTITLKHGIAAGAASDVFTNVPIEIILLD